MRLAEIRNGQRFSLKHRLMRFMMNRTMVGGAPGIVLSLMYRHQYFGKPMGELFSEVMRGESELSVTQRELIAAATSKANECPFCLGMHSTTASIANQTDGIIDMDFSLSSDELKLKTDPATALAMDFAEKLAGNPDDLQQSDIKALRDAGFSKAAVEDMIYIVFAFCLINRVANALDFEIPSEKGYKFSGNILIHKGYQV